MWIVMIIGIGILFMIKYYGVGLRGDSITALTNFLQKVGFCLFYTVFHRKFL